MARRARPAASCRTTPASQRGRSGARILIDDKVYWWRGALKDRDQAPAVCVNPLTWTAADAAPAAANPGSLPFPTAPFGPGPKPLALTAHLTGAVSRNGLLDVDVPWSAPAGFHDTLTLWFGSYHLNDYGVFYTALRRNAGERVATLAAPSPDRPAPSMANH